MLSLIVAALFVGLSVQASLPTRRYANSSCPTKFGPLQFSQDGTFQLAIFEDLHFGESERMHFSAAGSKNLLTIEQMPGTHGARSKTSTRWS
jgi:hypothetical protein